MHALHRILVNVVENELTTDEEIRNHAERETEEYNECFDWRETETAGRWADKYPNNVIKGSKNADKLREELERVIEQNANEIKSYIEIIAGVSEKGISPKSSLEEIVGYLSSQEAPSTARWGLLKIAEQLYGRYTFDTAFYDTERYDGKLNLDRIEEIMETPQNYALVLFDHHN